MSMVGQSRSLEIFICLLKIREPMVIDQHVYFPIGIGKVKLMTLLLQVPWLLIQEQKKICPKILILPHPTLCPFLFS